MPKTKSSTAPASPAPIDPTVAASLEAFEEAQQELLESAATPLNRTEMPIWMKWADRYRPIEMEHVKLMRHASDPAYRRVYLMTGATTETARIQEVQVIMFPATCRARRGEGFTLKVKNKRGERSVAHSSRLLVPKEWF